MDMLQLNTEKNQRIHHLFLCMVIYCGVLDVEVFAEKWNYIGNANAVHTLMFMAFGCVLVWGARQLGKTTDFDARSIQILWIIFLLGMIMRVGYMLYTPWYLRGHDVGAVGVDENCIGHAGYVLRLFYGKLPENNGSQFYHPPLYHFLAALTMHVSGWMRHIARGEDVIESAKVVSTVASMIALYQCKCMIDDLGIKGKASIITFSFLAFFPNYYLMGGRINNDCLAFMFCVLILRYTILWYRDSNWVNTILLAVWFGLGIMTKVSVATMALGTAIVMLYVFWQQWKNKNWKGLFLKFCGFGIISGGLGLWYAIRNYILYQQSFTYVPDTSLDSPLYCGDHSVLQRFGPDFSFLTNIFNNSYEDYNVFTFLFRGSLFGEWEFPALPVEFVKLYYCAWWLLLVVMIAIMIYMLVRKSTKMMYVFFGTFVVQMASYIWFNIQFPFGCTMDYRYIPITTIVLAFFTGMFGMQATKKADLPFYNYAWKGIQILVAFCSICSVTAYMIIGV